MNVNAGKNEDPEDPKEIKRKYTTITIPVSLYNKIQKKIEGTSFSSVSDYTTYVLREIIAEMEFSKNNKRNNKNKGKNNADDDIKNNIIKKFEALGYI